MPVNDQDARALTYLARRLREETLGAGKWDEAGIHAVVSELIGQHLVTTIERVMGHAVDTEARTPGAIRRPYTPTTKPLSRPLDVAPVGSRCTVCGEQAARCGQLWKPTGNRELDGAQGRHVFASPIERDTDLAPVIAELKGHLEPTREVLHDTKGEA